MQTLWIFLDREDIGANLVLGPPAVHEIPNDCHCKINRSDEAEDELQAVLVLLRVAHVPVDIWEDAR